MGIVVLCTLILLAIGPPVCGIELAPVPDWAVSEPSGETWAPAAAPNRFRGWLLGASTHRKPIVRHLALLALALLLLPAFAAAQSPETCRVGIYADSGGRFNGAGITFLTPLDVYVVLRVEDTVKAVAYQLEIETDYMEYLWIDASFGSEGSGLNVSSPGGFNVGLGACVPGYNEFPVFVARHTLLAWSSFGLEPVAKSPTVIAIAHVRANPDASPDAPVYASCDNRIESCPATDELYIYGPVATESVSMSRVKALYR
jgi:hypothetical protein